MSLITTQHLKLVLQTITKLLSFKADKTEVATKIDRSAISTNEDITEFISEMGIADPVTTSDGSIYTNANGDIYVL